MRAALLILIACAAPALAAQTVWKWVDDKGLVHYSDRPVPGATRIEVSTGNRYDPSASQAPAVEPAPAPAEEPPAAAQYQTLQITSPANDETIVNTAGQVPVQVQLEPGLQAGHSMYLYMDGFLVDGFPRNGTSHTLTDVPRGTHTLIATVHDSRGRRFQESPVTAFSVRQASIAQPPVGPTQRPRPKPRPNRNAGNKLPSK
ncbi:MAG: DUF4124 domain-containing protein, partial [Steroidobacteraceae bacterium]